MYAKRHRILMDGRWFNHRFSYMMMMMIEIGTIYNSSINTLFLIALDGINTSVMIADILFYIVASIYSIIDMMMRFAKGFIA